jgi:hypothetical protein
MARIIKKTPWRTDTTVEMVPLLTAILLKRGGGMRFRNEAPVGAL